MDFSKWGIFSLLEPEFASKIKLMYVYGTSGNEALIVTKDDEVFGIGSNASGCLGLGDIQSTLVPRKVESLCRKEIKGFAAGGGPHVLAFTTTGRLYSWGYNGYCELGTGKSSQNLVPTVVDFCEGCAGVIEIAAGSHHSIALTCDGEIYAWGQNNCGQVGSPLTQNQTSPKRVNNPGTKYIAVSCGQTSSFAVAESGEVYAWGYNGVGQLGIGNTVNQPVPVRVTGVLQNVVIKKIVSGYSHTLALSDFGKMYSWGGNSYGQLGSGDKSNSALPALINSDIGRVVDIAASHYSHISAAMTQNSKVYMWGLCHGQVVLKPTVTKFLSLHEVFACFSNPPVTWRTMEVDLDNSIRLPDSIRSAFDDRNTSDLTIVVDDKPIHVHKAILKIRCHHFRTMFQEPWRENSESCLVIDQFSYPVYRAFLEYLYTDDVQLPLEEAVELIDLATAYCESYLKKLCEQIIKQGITTENAASLYSAAIKYEAKELEDFCFKFFLNHMSAVVQSEGFNLLDEKTVKTFIAKAAKSGVFKT